MSAAGPGDIGSGPPTPGQDPRAQPAEADPWPQQTATYPATGRNGHQPVQYRPATRNNPLAVAALVCGIGQFFLGLLILGNIVLAIPAVICGAIGLRQTVARGERGRGMAKAGLILGILGVVYFVIVIVVLAEIGLHTKSS